MEKEREKKEEEEEEEQQPPPPKEKEEEEEEEEEEQEQQEEEEEEQEQQQQQQQEEEEQQEEQQQQQEEEEQQQQQQEEEEEEELKEEHQEWQEKKIEEQEKAGSYEKVDSDSAGMKKNPKKKSVTGTSCSDRKCVPGIIYLGHIPPRLRPKHLRNLLSVYGEIGRIFLQPEDGQVRNRKKKAGLRRCDFTEGWVEFTDKRVAKRVAASLHNTPMASRKRQRLTPDLWSMKYLHRFSWTHLSERLAYEQTVLAQRLRTEVSQAKRETNFYLNNVERGAHLDCVRRKRGRDGEQVEDKKWEFTQRRTEDEIQQQKKKKKDFITQKHLDKTRLLQLKSQSNTSLLAKIFNTKHTE